jgi:hypothetical protein
MGWKEYVHSVSDRPVYTEFPYKNADTSNLNIYNKCGKTEQENKLHYSRWIHHLQSQSWFSLPWLSSFYKVSFNIFSIVFRDEITGIFNWYMLGIRTSNSSTGEHKHTSTWKHVGTYTNNKKLEGVKSGNLGGKWQGHHGSPPLAGRFWLNK